MVSSKFLKIRCSRCRCSHIIYGRASTRVKCKSCNAPLNKTGGGKAKIKAQVTEIL